MYSGRFPCNVGGTATTQYVMLTKNQDAPMEEIKPGEFNQPNRLPQVA